MAHTNIYTYMYTEYTLHCDTLSNWLKKVPGTSPACHHALLIKGTQTPYCSRPPWQAHTHTHTHTHTHRHTHTHTHRYTHTDTHTSYIRRAPSPLTLTFSSMGVMVSPSSSEDDSESLEELSLELLDSELLPEDVGGARQVRQQKKIAAVIAEYNYACWHHAYMPAWCV